MCKRWLIRGVFLLPLLLSAGGWGWSLNHYTRAFYNSHSYGAIGFQTTAGILDLGISPRGNSSETNGWHYANYPRRDIRWLGWPDSSSLPWQRLGFGFDHGAYGPDVRCPYYFLILLCGVPLAFVWRKTRGTMSPATAFPVEMTRG